MDPLLFFIFICAVASVCFVLGHRIGYLTGKAEVSDITRGESPHS